MSAALAACMWAAPALAGIVVFSETFDGPGLPDTLTYSGEDPPAGHWSIDAANRLLIDIDGTKSLSTLAITKDGFKSPDLAVVYSLDVGIPTGASTGGYPVGIDFGGYRAVFHPGYAVTGVLGAFRIRGGFSAGNMSMGFVPQKGVLHHMEVTTWWSGSDLAVDVEVTGLGTDDLMHQFNYSFIDTSPNIGSGTFGAHRHGGSGNEFNDAFFDNFKAEILPEPASLALVGAGLLALLRRRKR